ncbi:carbohydrate-binding module family 13 protein, partial [Coniophora puteana RWD-64-598 SS2]
MKFLSVAALLLPFALASPLEQRDATTTATSSAPASTQTGVLPSIPRGQEYQDPPPGNGRRIRPYGRGDLALTVQAGYPGIGTLVQLGYNFGNNDGFVELQLFNITSGGGFTELKLQNTTSFEVDIPLCVDAGDENGALNVGNELKLQKCNNSTTQSWDFSTHDYLSVGEKYCMTIADLPYASTNKPYRPVLDVQLIECQLGSNSQPTNNETFFILPYPNN